MTPKELEKIIKLRKNFMRSEEILAVMKISPSSLDRVVQFLGYHGEYELRRCGGLVDHSLPLDDDRYASIAEYAVAHDWGADKAAIIFKVNRNHLRLFINRRKNAGEPIHNHMAELPPKVSLNREYDPCRRGFRRAVVLSLNPGPELPAPSLQARKGVKSKLLTAKPKREPLGPKDGLKIKNVPKLSLDLEK